MIDWLCEVLGFARHAVHADDAGGIAHAELTLGDGMVMLGSVRDTAFGALQGPPGDGRAGASPYLVLPDDAEVEAAHARAVAAGAEIAMPLEAKDYGGLAVTIRDPEGGLWNLGSYDPWAAARG
ncbi:VOC family protein [Albimonas sp. CAU 1670]|nr:VOC family protein [Albimonas sp. CAU 1670]MDF2232874.1 VOC family protein [Albimonas sp. CAU 1670]